ncbi:hypothetical protein [Nocardioides sp. B-3]|uniref:hypothetical protein n=1 Tax=Nocardioides sp. B-3 TaxID=2895565 RepID=UPI0021535E0B|nr:hypothetical protein [Nocardioides sp. B-3]UUZ59626.1 hypothetical protein LP418_00165 [Nocardioides sp. B-3]
MATSTRSSTDTLPDTPAGVLSALRAEQDARQSSEVRSMRLAAHWVALHPVLDRSCPDACFQSPKTLAGVGSPVIDEFTIPDIATMLGQTCDAVGSYLTDVIELRYRLPQLWAGVPAGLVTPWRARRIAQTTVGLSVEAATFVDEQTAWCANRLTPTELGRLVDHARARFMPDQLAKETEDAADRRHVTFDTDRVSFDGTLHLEADLDLPRRPRPGRGRCRRCRPPTATGLDRHVGRAPGHRPRRPRPPPTHPRPPRRHRRGTGPPVEQRRACVPPPVEQRRAQRGACRNQGSPDHPDRPPRPPLHRRHHPPRPREQRPVPDRVRGTGRRPGPHRRADRRPGAAAPTSPSP